MEQVSSDRRAMFGATGLLSALLSGVVQAAPTEPAAPRFHFVRVYEGPDGRSHIEELDPRQAEEKLPYLYRAKAASVAILTIPAGTELDWHLTHNGIRRLLVSVCGLSVTIVDDGAIAGQSYYPLMAGSVFFAEDVSGRGHKGKIFADEDAIVFQVDLAD